MAITAIRRDWSYEPSLVRIVSTNTLAQVGTAGYILAEDDNIVAINNGAFEWLTSDAALVQASDGWAIYSISADFESLDLITAANLPDGSVTTAKLAAGAVTLAKLAAGITPSHVIKYANQVTTVGGAAAEAFTVTGALAASDRAFVQVVNNGTSNVTVLQAVVTNDTLTVTFSADPVADTVINYQIIRAAS